MVRLIMRYGLHQDGSNYEKQMMFCCLALLLDIEKTLLVLHDKLTLTRNAMLIPIPVRFQNHLLQQLFIGLGVTFEWPKRQGVILYLSPLHL
jgi:hypothetical protein